MTDTSTNIGWTPQSNVGFIHEVAQPGQTFTEDQMPDPEVQRAAGINPELYRSAHGLYVDPAAAPKPYFVGTETGLDAKSALAVTGNVESFMSVASPATQVAESEQEEQAETPQVEQAEDETPAE
jgi:hypothetical protein